jgi:L-alanine-DL-glutamate epimerase-like enolase superfamily enzyme
MEITRKSFLRSVLGAATASRFLKAEGKALSLAQEKARVPVKAVKIRDVEIFPFTLQQKAPMKIALPTPLTMDNVFVRLRTEDGVTGVGEASPYSAVTSETQQTDVAMAHDLADLVRSRDPFTLARIVDDMDMLSPNNPSIKAAFEMALWDICGKIADLPICCLLGKYRDSFETDKTVFIETPAVMAEGARDVVREGFRTVKVKVGESPEKDIARLAAIREAVGADIALRIDANQGWTPAEAVRSLHGIEKYNIQACEQPVPHWDMDGLRYVRDHSSIPIMADESVHSPHDAIEAVRKEAVDLINIKLMKTGGILNAVRVAQISAAAGIQCMLGCMNETSLALTAAAHVIASQKNLIYADLDSFLFNVGNPIIGGMEIKQGVVYLPATPGLGLDIEPTFLKKLTPA